MRKKLYVVCSFCILVACERTSLSPVEIKIDDGIGGYATVSSVNNTYTVRNGETLFDIANKFNIDPMNLAKLNGIEAPYDVRDGQVLRLPSEDDAIQHEQSPSSYAPVQIEEKPEVKTNELDEKFNKMMNQGKKKDEDESSKAAPLPVADKAAKGSGFNEQADELSAPKVVSTATGAAIAGAGVAASAVAGTGEAVGSAASTGTSRSEEAATVSAGSATGHSSGKNSEAKESGAKAIAADVSEPKNSSGKMPRPVKGKVISGFGDMLDGIPNDGINIKANAGTAVNTVGSGEVLYAGNKLDESFGNVVVVKHDNGMVSSYANLQDISVKQGAKIKTGQKIGTVGQTGDVTEPQLHFEIMKDNTPLNPEKYLEK